MGSYSRLDATVDQTCFLISTTYSGHAGVFLSNVVKSAHTSSICEDAGPTSRKSTGKASAKL